MTPTSSPSVAVNTEMNGYFPWVKGCTTDQSLVESRPVWDKYNRYVGRVELWWSARCVTNWLVMRPNNPYGLGLHATISNQFGSEGWHAFDHQVGNSGMLYSPSWSPCVNIDILVNPDYPNTFNDRAPRYTIC